MLLYCSCCLTTLKFELEKNVHKNKEFCINLHEITTYPFYIYINRSLVNVANYSAYHFTFFSTLLVWPLLVLLNQWHILCFYYFKIETSQVDLYLFAIFCQHRYYFGNSVCVLYIKALAKSKTIQKISLRLLVLELEVKWKFLFVGKLIYTNRKFVSWINHFPINVEFAKHKFYCLGWYKVQSDVCYLFVCFCCRFYRLWECIVYQAHF